jgi:hypothetical protein
LHGDGDDRASDAEHGCSNFVQYPLRAPWSFSLVDTTIDELARVQRQQKR